VQDNDPVMMLKLPKLIFPPAQLKFKEENGKPFIYDIVRLSYVALTPEEWVRQHCIHYLRNYKGFSSNLMGVEKSLELNGQKFRFDLVCYDKNVRPLLLVECKAPDVAISQATIDQIIVYNMKLNVPVLMMTNGKYHIACYYDAHKNDLSYLSDLPDYRTIVELLDQ
jgi:hypothetical protein